MLRTPTQGQYSVSLSYVFSRAKIGHSLSGYEVFAPLLFACMFHKFLKSVMADSRRLYCQHLCLNLNGQVNSDNSSFIDPAFENIEQSCRKEISEYLRQLSFQEQLDMCFSSRKPEIPKTDLEVQECITGFV